MVFIRLKRIKGLYYAYLCKSVWIKGKGSRQETIKYLGRVPGESKLTPEKIKYIFAKYDFTCQICGKKTDLVIDHFIPLSKGGCAGELENLWLLCKNCNFKKGNKILKKKVIL